jgi:two-component system cell cycle response regulator DivK
MAGEQILIVEDNRNNMKLFQDVLRATGYRTLEASTGAQALMLAAAHRPALVLMDIRLPDTSGVEALSRLRTDERTAAIPVLAVTAQAMVGDRERFIEAGFDGYLSKPVDIDELLATVEEHCGGLGRAIDPSVGSGSSPAPSRSGRRRGRERGSRGAK